MLGGSLTSLVKFTACETFQHFMYKHGWGTHANTLLLMLYYVVRNGWKGFVACADTASTQNRGDKELAGLTAVLSRKWFRPHRSDIPESHAHAFTTLCTAKH